MKVYLRALEIEDYKIINRWRSQPDVIKYLSGNVYFVSSELEKKSIENKIFDDSENIYLGICTFNQNQLIGYTSINNIDLRNRKAEWGGTIIGEKSFIGKGLGKQAAALMLRYLFDQFPIHKCYAYCLAEHPSTRKLFQALGFQKDGVLRDDVFKNGEFKEIEIYSILRNETNGKF